MPGNRAFLLSDESYSKLNTLSTPECQQVLSRYEVRPGNFLRIASMIFLDNDHLWGEYWAAKKIVEERQKQAYSIA